MANTIKVLVFRYCDLCPTEDEVIAHYDGKTQWGPWANMCEKHFAEVGVGLGTGKGHKFEYIYEA